MGSTISSLIHQITWPKAIAIAIPLGLGSIVGALQAKPTIDWYPTLDKPSWTPPAPLFGQAWSVFYAVMGYASYLVWKQGGIEAQKRPLTFYGLQLVFNLCWPVTFFLRKKLGQAQIVNLATLALASATAWEFYKVDAFAGKILLPYLAWLVFANALNYSIWKKNPGAGAPLSARESLYEGEDKKNPGNEGYGPLQGRASASYSPHTVRTSVARTAKSAAVPKVLLQQHSFGQRLSRVCHRTLATKAHAVARPTTFRRFSAMTHASGRCLVV
ncbi:hypothetical protein ABBQ32_013361 [Trebouxia sp. C0010 RCD-2024]